MATVANRIRLLTAEEFERLPDDDFKYELVEGRVVKMSPPGARHGAIAVRLGHLLYDYVDDRKLGVVMTETGYTLQRDPDTVRGPDLSFVRAERLSDGLPRGFFSGPPDFVVEIVSPDDRLRELRDKAAEYLMRGVHLVWVVDPVRKRVTQYSTGCDPVIFTIGDQLDGGNVIPGFRCDVSAILSDF